MRIIALMSFLVLSCGKSKLDEPLTVSSQLTTESKILSCEKNCGKILAECLKVANNYVDQAQKAQKIGDCETLRSECDWHCTYCDSFSWDITKFTKKELPSICTGSGTRHEPMNCTPQEDLKIYCKESDWK